MAEATNAVTVFVSGCGVSISPSVVLSCPQWVSSSIRRAASAALHMPGQPIRMPRLFRRSRLMDASRGIRTPTGMSMLPKAVMSHSPEEEYGPRLEPVPRPRIGRGMWPEAYRG